MAVMIDASRHTYVVLKQGTKYVHLVKMEAGQAQKFGHDELVG